MRHIASILILCIVYPSFAQEATFTGLGFLPDGKPFSSAFGISHDGLVVVGQGNGINGPEGYYWEGGEISGVGDLPGGSFSSNAWATSGDGSVIVGRSTSANGTEAFRWENGVIEALGDLPGGSFESIARDVSADGSVVVGKGHRPLHVAAFRWEAGVMEELPGLVENEHTDAFAVSADGRFVAGYAENSEGQGEAVRWVDGVPQGLGVPEGYWDTLAYDISTDGRVVVGRALGTGITRAFVWREGEGMSILPDLPGGSEYREAFAISGDGRVIGGTASGPEGFEATLWIDGELVVSVKDFLENQGLDLSGWRLAIVADQGLSFNGTVVAGAGKNPQDESEGWRAVLPPWPVANEPETPQLAHLTTSVYPNPMRGNGTVRVVLPVPSVGRVAVLDVLGRKVAVIHVGPLSAGRHLLSFSSQGLSPGIYIVRADFGEAGFSSEVVTVLR